MHWRLPRRAVQLGNTEQAKENKREADRYAKTLQPILIELRHLPVEKIADELTKQKSPRRVVVAGMAERWQGCLIDCTCVDYRASWLDGLSGVVFSGVEISAPGSGALRICG